MPTIFDVDRRKSGLYNHYNDQYMISPTQVYAPPAFNPEAQAENAASTRRRTRSQAAAERAQPAAYFPAAPVAPQIYVYERRTDPWLYYYFGRMMGFWEASPQVYQGGPAVRVKTQFRPATPAQKKKEAENDQPGFLAAMMFFIAAVAAAGLAVAYSLDQIRKIGENLLARRKMTVTSIRLLVGGLIGFAGGRLGVTLGAFYGPAFFGETFGTLATAASVGAGLGGFLLATTGAALGFLAGKYFAKLCVYVYTRGKTSNSDPYTLAPATERELAKKFTQQSSYPGSRPNLMLNYLQNKIEIAKQNQASEEWVKTLTGFVRDLKNGQLPDELKQYFDTEFGVLRYEWYTAMRTPHDPRFANEKLEQVQQDFVSIAIITSNEAQLLSDFAQFTPAAVEEPAPSAPPAEPNVTFLPYQQAKQAQKDEASKVDPLIDPTYTRGPIPVGALR